MALLTFQSANPKFRRSVVLNLPILSIWKLKYGFPIHLLSLNSLKMKGWMFGLLQHPFLWPPDMQLAVLRPFWSTAHRSCAFTM